MGGSNQSTCPAPPSSSVSRKTSKPTRVFNPIRFHEETGRGEVDFHDDQGGLKCAVDSAVFFSAYSAWRPKMSDEMTLTGDDGSGSHTSVTFIPYVDDAGELQVGISVDKAKMGQTIIDLDKLAHFT